MKSLMFSALLAACVDPSARCAGNGSHADAPVAAEAPTAATTSPPNHIAAADAYDATRVQPKSRQ